jgi:hypothetical protein
LTTKQCPLGWMPGCPLLSGYHPKGENPSFCDGRSIE